MAGKLQKYYGNDISTIVLPFRRGGDGGTRTLDPLLAKQVLWPTELHPQNMVELGWPKPAQAPRKTDQL